MTSDVESEKKLQTIIKKRGKAGLKIDDWILGMQSYGIPADKIAEIVKSPIP
jgi:hypothetical protein